MGFASDTTACPLRAGCPRRRRQPPKLKAQVSSLRYLSLRLVCEQCSQRSSSSAKRTRLSAIVRKVGGRKHGREVQLRAEKKKKKKKKKQESRASRC